ncbi:MAG: chromate efflux transporter [Gammaproteobacteria bacterium]|nr:chromate efflux transporter [Gammaproteobacteria bacterium]
MNMHQEKASVNGTVAEVFVTFLKLGLTSFGGPVAHLGYFRTELVERRRWLSENQYSQLLAICQFLPGPASSQMGFSLGLMRAGWFGALSAFLAFTLPSVLLLVAFASVLPQLSGPVGQAAIHGLKIVACAVVADAVLGMSRNLCPDALRRSIAILAAAVLLLVDTAWIQLLVVAGGAVAGILVCRVAATEASVKIQIGYGARTGGLLLLLFFVLLSGLPLLAPANTALMSIADAFYRAGALVFGGGHVVLPLLEDAVVATGWVTRQDFLAGYGASQAIPGPMFAFSAYLGAVISSDQAWWLNAATALLFIFLPGFLLVAAVLPLWRAISHNQLAANAIAGVNAAVVGLLGAALYDPIFISGITNGAELAIGLIAFSLLAVWRLSVLVVVAWCVAASVLPVLL